MTNPEPHTTGNGSSLAFGGGEQLGPHPVGESLSGALGSVSDCSVFVGSGAELDRFGARVIDAGAAGSHAVENSGHEKSLTRGTLEGHNKSMTSTGHEIQIDNSPLGGRRHSYTPCCSCGWTSAGTFANQVAAATAAVAHRAGSGR